MPRPKKNNTEVKPKKKTIKTQENNTEKDKKINIGYLDANGVIDWDKLKEHMKEI